MVTVIQRCISAKVKINNKVIAEIDQGAVILLGIVNGDQIHDADYIANKSAMLRIYNDHNNKMNLSIKESLERRKSISNDRIEAEGVEFLKRVSKGFLNLSKERKWIQIDADQNSSAVNHSIASELSRFFVELTD